MPVFTALKDFICTCVSDLWLHIISSYLHSGGRDVEIVLATFFFNTIVCLLSVFTLAFLKRSYLYVKI